MEQLDYDLSYRWFVGLGIDDPVWHPTAFTTNRDRLLAGEVAASFLAAVLSHPQVKILLSREHFTVDGTLVEAWASLKSFRPQGWPGHARDCAAARRGSPGWPCAPAGRPDRPQRVIRGHSGLELHIAEQASRPPIVAPHRSMPHLVAHFARTCQITLPAQLS